MGNQSGESRDVSDHCRYVMILLDCERCSTFIGGFRDTYLGRQVVSRPGGPRARWGQLGVWASAVSSSSGVWGGARAEVEFGAF